MCNLHLDYGGFRNAIFVKVKKLYVIAGPNGAGKTTLSYTILPEIFECDEFVNADEIAKGLSPFNPEKAAIKAGRLMLERIKELILKRESFAFETTLSTRSYVRRLHNKMNMKFHFFF